MPLFQEQFEITLSVFELYQIDWVLFKNILALAKSALLVRRMSLDNRVAALVIA